MVEYSLEVILSIYRFKKVCFRSENGMLESSKFALEQLRRHFDSRS